MAAEEPLILVVDDLASNRMLLEEVLDDLEVRVISVSNGPEALAAVEKEMPALAILDFQMPLMNGVELATRMKAMARAPFVYILLTSGYAEASEIGRYEDGIIDAVLAKPYSLSHLRQAVGEGLAAARFKRGPRDAESNAS